MLFRETWSQESDLSEVKFPFPQLVPFSRGPRSSQAKEKGRQPSQGTSQPRIQIMKEYCLVVWASISLTMVQSWCRWRSWYRWRNCYTWRSWCWWRSWCRWRWCRWRSLPRWRSWYASAKSQEVHTKRVFILPYSSCAIADMMLLFIPIFTVCFVFYHFFVSHHFLKLYLDGSLSCCPGKVSNWKQLNHDLGKKEASSSGIGSGHLESDSSHVVEWGSQSLSGFIREREKFRPWEQTQDSRCRSQELQTHR